MDDCPICAKHRGEGPLTGGPGVWSDEFVVVHHRPPDADGTVVPGHLFVETVRHVDHLDQLSDAEAAAAGLAATRLARALRAELTAEHVFTAVIGTGVAHYHQHVIARHPGTPPAVPWHASHSWPDAPRIDATELTALAARLRDRMAAGT